MRTVWLGVFLSVNLVSAAACGPSATQAGACGAGRTILDGVCVNERVADYVSCVRAQGAQLGQDRSQKLSAEAGFAGTRAAGASEVKDTLERKYAVSDANTLEIIRACNAAAGMSGATGGAQSTSAAPAPGASTADGRRRPDLAPPPGCTCMNWRDARFAVRAGNGYLCGNGAACATHFGLQGNECADPTADGYPWCYLVGECPGAGKSDDGVRWYAKCGAAGSPP